MGLFAVLGDKSKEHQQPGFETKMRKRKRRKYRELWSKKEKGNLMPCKTKSLEFNIASAKNKKMCPKREVYFVQMCLIQNGSEPFVYICYVKSGNFLPKTQLF